MYENSKYQEVYDEAYRKAKSYDIFTLMGEFGYSMKKCGSNQYQSREHDSLKVYYKNNEWHWKWFSQEGSDISGGDCISFVRKERGCSYLEAIDYLSDGMITKYYDEKNMAYNERKCQRYVSKPKVTASFNYEYVMSDDNDKVFIPPKEYKDCRKTFEYLTGTDLSKAQRGLDPNIISHLIKKDFIREEEIFFNNHYVHNIVFKMYDYPFLPNRQYVGAEKVSTELNQETNKVWKGLHKNSHCSTNGFEIHFKNSSNNGAIFFESAIDLLSLATILKNYPNDVANDFGEEIRQKLMNCRFVSITGVKDSVVRATIEKYNINEENVWIATDNDKAGEGLADKVRETYPNIRRIVPCQQECKDWNDYLRLKRGMITLEKLAEQRQKKEAEQAKQAAKEKTLKENTQVLKNNTETIDLDSELANSSSFTMPHRQEQPNRTMNKKTEIIDLDIELGDEFNGR